MEADRRRARSARAGAPDSLRRLKLHCELRPELVSFEVVEVEKPVPIALRAPRNLRGPHGIEGYLVGDLPQERGPDEQGRAGVAAEEGPVERRENANLTAREHGRGPG